MHGQIQLPSRKRESYSRQSVYPHYCGHLEKPGFGLVACLRICSILAMFGAAGAWLVFGLETGHIAWGSLVTLGCILAAGALVLIGVIPPPRDD